MQIFKKSFLLLYFFTWFLFQCSCPRSNVKLSQVKSEAQEARTVNVDKNSQNKDQEANAAPLRGSQTSSQIAEGCKCIPSIPINQVADSKVTLHRERTRSKNLLHVPQSGSDIEKKSTYKRVDKQVNEMSNQSKNEVEQSLNKVTAQIKEKQKEYTLLLDKHQGLIHQKQLLNNERRRSLGDELTLRNVERELSNLETEQQQLLYKIEQLEQKRRNSC